MKSIYLDQNKFIDLARAHHGRADGEKYKPALEHALHSVQTEQWRIPLSIVHVMETGASE